LGYSVASLMPSSGASCRSVGVVLRSQQYASTQIRPHSTTTLEDSAVALNTFQKNVIELCPRQQ
ncbi:hypothetical protein Csa_018917, partial [Cucumis sativus]